MDQMHTTKSTKFYTPQNLICTRYNNNDKLSFMQERKQDFIKGVLQLFKTEFPKDTANHLEQVAALHSVYV